MVNSFYKRFIFEKFTKHNVYFCTSNLYYLYDNALSKLIVKSAVITQIVLKGVSEELYYTILILFFFLLNS